MSRFRACGAPAGRSEHVGPHVEHRQQIVTAMGVRRGDNHRLPGQVEPRAGIKRVEVRPHDDFEISGRVSRDVVEHVHRTLAEFLAGFDVDGLLARDVHRDERVKVKIGVDADGCASCSVTAACSGSWRVTRNPADIARPSSPVRMVCVMRKSSVQRLYFDTPSEDRGLLQISSALQSVNECALKFGPFFLNPCSDFDT